MMSKQIILAVCALHAFALESTAPWFYRQSGRPLIISHRGSTGHLPEHTLATYTDAWLAGADWIELDLHMTSDGVLIC